MPFERASGVLAHPTSFPGPHGIGDLGDGAHRFVDWLQEAGQRLWQIMPLVPTGYGDSPYASPSAFAGNPLLVSLDWLVGDGLLDEGDVRDHGGFPAHRVDYEAAATYKQAKLRHAYNRWRRGAGGALRPDYGVFVEQSSAWLDDFSLFMAVKQAQQGAAWISWPEEIALRREGALTAWRERHADEVEFQRFVQFLFFRQWTALKRYANERGVRVIGDIPIFVAYDSADVWANQSLFRLDERGRLTVVAGVPPDYFSETGQLWGNPHYDWAAMEADGFGWWIERFRQLLRLVDVVRIDHFRGFAAAWTVPAADDTAATGRWERGPGRAVFDAVNRALGEVPIIVEDLGLITPDVRELRRALGYPGMAVLQFAFGEEADNVYLPHNYDERIVVYTGTHDNQTTTGWFASAPDHVRRHVQTYLGRDGTDVAWDFIRVAMGSVAELAIVPLQDVLRLGDEARMNMPGVAGGNWAWRFTSDQLDPRLAEGLAALTTTYRRGLEHDEVREPDPYDYTAPGTKHPLV